jgi:hypothetical protein
MSIAQLRKDFDKFSITYSKFFIFCIHRLISKAPVTSYKSKGVYCQHKINQPVMEEANEIINSRNLPLYKKGKEIFNVVHRITELIPKDNQESSFIKEIMLSDASLLMIKVAGAEGAGLYDLKMEAAAIIRKAARDLKL